MTTSQKIWKAKRQHVNQSLGKAESAGEKARATLKESKESLTEKKLRRMGDLTNHPASRKSQILKTNGFPN